jgi:phage recombination protein Bet
MNTAVAERTAPSALPPARTSLVARIADRYGVEPAKMLDTLKATAFKQGKEDPPVNNEQMMALLIVAEQYRLNPFTKELFAFPDKRGGIVPVVSVDGWSRIINEHRAFDGIEFVWSDSGDECTCIIYRKDRSHPIKVTEYLSECKRSTEPWGKWPRRMLRHKAMIQCARLAFGFAGIYDEDEAQRIVQAGEVVELPSISAQRVRAALAQAGDAPPPPTAGPPEVMEHAMVDDDGADGTAPGVPHAKRYALFIDEISHATDAETAGLVLDEARSVLDPQQHAELVAIYRNTWQQED